MKYTNRLKLPQPLFQAICADEYSAGASDISTTSLSVPSRIWALKRLHEDEITEDASDRIWSFMGSIGHKIAERNAQYSDEEEIIETLSQKIAGGIGKTAEWLCSDLKSYLANLGWRAKEILTGRKRYITEVRYYVDFIIRELAATSIKIGGQIDLYDRDTFTLYDYKVTSYWVAKEGVKPEWQEQASVNRYLLEKNGIEVRAVKYIAIFRDWSKSRAGQNGMPEEQVMAFNIQPWPLEQTEQWIKDRIASHYGALQALPECTAEERWAKQDQWAVMQKGRKRAVKLYEYESTARSHCDQDDSLYLEKRPGESTRCKDYCPVSKFCTQYQKMQQA